MSVCPSVCVCLSMSPSILLSLCISLHTILFSSTCLSLCLCMFVCLSAFSFCLSDCLVSLAHLAVFICFSVCLCTPACVYVAARLKEETYFDAGFEVKRRQRQTEAEKQRHTKTYGDRLRSAPGQTHKHSESEERNPLASVCLSVCLE